MHSAELRRSWERNWELHAITPTGRIHAFPPRVLHDFTPEGEIFPAGLTPEEKGGGFRVCDLPKARQAWGRGRGGPGGTTVGKDRAAVGKDEAALARIGRVEHIIRKENHI